jgi:hypothetical protein
VLPARGEAGDAAYKWINFVMQPDIVPIMSANTGRSGGEGAGWRSCREHGGGKGLLLPEDLPA